jgi:hypothetical protein
MGVLVRLEPGGQPVTAAPQVRLAPLSGEDAIEITLNDDGSPPDVVASDGRWAGVAMTPISAFSVSVSVGGEQMDAGEVTWTEEGAARDLVLTLMWGGVTAEASSPGQAGAAPSQAAAGGGAPVASGGAPPSGATSGGLAPLATASTPPSRGQDGWVWLALGLGSLGLVGGLVLLLRGGRRGPSEVQLDRAPEPPLFGPGSPALHQGLSVWQVASPDRDLFLEGLVTTVALQHRVLLVLPESAPVPAVQGGPVYVCRDTDTRLIEDHLVDMLDRPGLPVVAVFVEADPTVERIGVLEELLKPDLGGILVTAFPPAARDDVIKVTLHPDGAALAVDGRDIALARGRFGYAPQG